MVYEETMKRLQKAVTILIAVANILLQNLLKRLPDQEPGVAVFARQ